MGIDKYINDELVCPKCGSYMKEWILHWRCRKLSCGYGINKSEAKIAESGIMTKEESKKYSEFLDNTSEIVERKEG